MAVFSFPTIDLQATGSNIVRLRKARGLSVRDLQRYFGFEEPQAIYKWQRGQSLPTVDNLYALSALFGVPMNEILVSSSVQKIHFSSVTEQPAQAGCSDPFRVIGHFWKAWACSRILPRAKSEVIKPVVQSPVRLESFA